MLVLPFEPVIADHAQAPPRADARDDQPRRGGEGRRRRRTTTTRARPASTGRSATTSAAPAATAAAREQVAVGHLAGQGEEHRARRRRGASRSRREPATTWSASRPACGRSGRRRAPRRARRGVRAITAQPGLAQRGARLVPGRVRGAHAADVAVVLVAGAGPEDRVALARPATTALRIAASGGLTS